MRGLRTKWTVAVLGVGLLATAARAQDKDTDYHSLPEPKPAWYSNWFGLAPAKPPAKKTVVPPETPPTRVSMVDAAQSQREQEEKAYWRRYDACVKLLEIAEEKNDDSLRRSATELQTRAWEIYQQRTAKLPLKAGAYDDETALDKKLGVKAKPTFMDSNSNGSTGQASNMRGDR